MAFKDHLDVINQITADFIAAFASDDITSEVGIVDTAGNTDIPLLLVDYDYISSDRLGSKGLSDKMQWTYSFIDDRINYEKTNLKLEKLLELFSDQNYTVIEISKIAPTVNETRPCIGWKVTVQ